MANRYLIGAAVLGGDVTIPKAGVTYTDEATVRAVQSALRDRGFDPGPVDGVFGPKTARGIRAMQAAAGMAQTGVIDYGVLMALKVQAQSEGGASAPTTSSVPSGGYSSIFQSSALATTQPGVASPSFMMQPLWPGAPVKRWQAIFGAAAGLLAALGISMVVRR